MCSSRGLVAVVSFLAGVASFGAIVEGGDFVRHPDGGAVRAKTSFAISSDPQDWNLVVDIDCEVRDLAKFRAADGDGGDHVEVFLSPDGNVQHYYQFMVNAKGEKRFAAYFEEKGDIQPDPYMPEWKYERRETEKGWAVRITIPYYSFYMTRNDRWSGEWLVNVARGNGIDGEKSTWNRLYGSFHDADHFRRVSGFPKRQKAFDVVIESAEVMIDGVRDGRYRGKMKVFARSLAPAMYTLRTSVSEPVTAKVISTGSPIYVDCSFPNLGRNVVDFELQLQKPWGKWTGRYARSYPVMVAFDPLKVKLTVPAYRDSFYPGQATDRVAGMVTNEAPGGIRLTLEGGGMPLAERTLPKSGAFSFDTSSFTNGEMVLTVTAGTETRRMRIRKIEPNGHRMSWIENGIIRVDGKPMFPKSMAAEGYKGGEAFAKRFFSDRGLLRTSEELSRVRIEAKRLVKGIEEREAKKDVKPCAELLAAMDRVIEENRGKDFGWYYLCDEPEMRGISEIYLRHCYEYIKSRDPYHVVGIHSRNAARFIEAADWFETHPYLDPHLDGEGRRIYNIAINRFGDFVSPVADLGRPDKVIGVIPTCFSYRFKNPLSDYPTWDEYNCTTWATILRGAKSVQPFFYADMGDRFWLYEGTKRIFRTISALEDLLLFGKRTALKRSAFGDATLYEFGDERMFVAVNFENAPHALRLGDLSGHFREFGGTREWTGVTTLEMKPLEVIIATTRKRDDGIGSAADFRKAMDRAEGARTHRDNQLFGKEKEIEVRAKFGRNPLFNTSFKLFDGVRDVLAWSGAGKDNAMELAFKGPRTMRSLRLYGAHLEKTSVSVKSGDGWKRLEPASDDSEAFSRVLFFAEPVGVEALRLEFGPDPVELYEIEIPAEPVRAVVPVEQKAGWAIKWWMPRHREKLAAATNGHHRVVFLGDSITHYWETNGSNVWNRCFAGAPYHALDLGFSGDRTEHLLWRIGNGELDGYETDCIVLLIGTNNSGQLSLDAEPPEHTVLGIKAVLEAIRRKQPKAKVILTAIFPCRLDPNAGVEQRNRKVNAEIRKLADGQEVIWLDLNERFLKPYGGHSQKLFPDIVHPNEAGYEIWAKALVPEIDRVLGSMGK